MEHSTYKKALYGTAIFGIVMISIAALSYANTYANSFTPDNGWNTLSVSAEGTATGIPDVAQISFSVTNDGKDAQTAQDATSKKMDEITKYLMDKGVSKEDVQTTGYNIYPKQSYTCPPGRVAMPCSMTTSGYTAEQSVQVKVRDTGTAGELIAGAVSRGATDTSGPTFVIDDRSKFEDEARGKAIEAAKRKAESITRQSGIHLGKLLSVSDDTGVSAPGPYYSSEGAGMGMMAKDAVAPNIQPGSQDVRMSVTLTYSLK